MEPIVAHNQTSFEIERLWIIVFFQGIKKQHLPQNSKSYEKYWSLIHLNF